MVKADDIIRRYLKSPTGAVPKAEKIAIRAAAYLGETPPPLNSSYAAIWELKTGSQTAKADWTGWAIAEHLRHVPPAAGTDTTTGRPTGHGRDAVITPPVSSRACPTGSAWRC